MPFTPLHMGTSLLIKGFFQGFFSIMVFGWTQIIIDIQPLVVLITGKGLLHGFSHTFIGASIIAIIAALTGKYLSELILNRIHYSNIKKPIIITWKICFYSAFIGAFSHVFLDAIMHVDVEPFYPFTKENYFLGLLSIQNLHKYCIYSGLIGSILYFIIKFYFKIDIKLSK